MSVYFINGKRVGNFSGGNIVVNNGRVIIDGREIETEDSPVINIVVEGNVDALSGDFANITVKGNASAIKTVSGNVEVGGSVSGDVKTVSGNVRANGPIGGNVKSVSGDIRSGR